MKIWLTAGRTVVYKCHCWMCEESPYEKLYDKLGAAFFSVSSILFTFRIKPLTEELTVLITRREYFITVLILALVFLIFFAIFYLLKEILEIRTGKNVRISARYKICIGFVFVLFFGPLERFVLWLGSLVRPRLSDGKP